MTTVARGRSKLPDDVAERMTKARAEARKNLDISLVHFPEQLKNLPNWVVWRYEAVQNKDGEWRLTKVPYIAELNDRRNAGSNRPKEWRPLEVAQIVLRHSGGNYDGVGFMFTDSGFSGVDLDHVLSNGSALPLWVTELMGAELASTYIERSISDTGLHGILGGVFTGGGIKEKFEAEGTGFELYCKGRFFVVTGCPYNGAGSFIRNGDGDVQSLYDRFKRGEIGPDDFRAQQKAKAAKRADAPKRIDDAKDFLDLHGIEVHGTNAEASFTRYSVTCPGCGVNNAYVMQHADGGVSMGCYHQTCSFSNMKDHWSDFRKFHEAKSPTSETGKTQSSAKPKQARATGREVPQPKYDPKTGDLIGPIPTVGDTLLAEHFFAHNEGEKLHVYRAGTYYDRGDVLVRRCAKQIMQKLTGGKQWSKGLSVNLEEWVFLDSKPLWESPPLDRINLLNGIFNLKTGVLESHTPDWLSPIQLPVRYDPKAECSNIDDFLAHVLPADMYEQEVAYQLAALLMIPYMGAQRAVLLQGDRGTGKSRFLSLLRAFLGSRNVSTKSLHQLEENRFASAYLYGKLANIFADLPARHLETTSTFKQVTGEDYIDGEYKRGAQFHFKPFCRLLFSSNLPPQSKDVSGAFLDRWWVFPFDQRFEGSAQQVAADVLDRKLARASELSGLLNRALRSLPLVLEQHGISVTSSMREAHGAFCSATDPFRVWLDQDIIDNVEGVTPMDEAYRSYQGFRTQRALPMVTKVAFGLELKRLKPKIQYLQRRVGGRLQWSYIGIRLKTKPQSKENGSSE